jgi:Mrp family chromosome partitioning ATPase
VPSASLAAKPQASPADPLQSARTAEILRDLSARFDVVIVGTPPVLGVHDAEIVARHADLTVMVVLDIPVNGVILSRVNFCENTRGLGSEDDISRSLRKYYMG